MICDKKQGSTSLHLAFSLDPALVEGEEGSFLNIKRNEELIMTLLCYHGFNNWQNFMLEGENERDNILFGFELEATQDSDFEGNIVSPEEMAGCLKNEFGNLFVYERDSSIGCGLEIISNP
ncbi:hypothetical protein [Thomasclavelia cocleata]|uniref:hypothetical protein n=1 Tax=Thomasclavelia cocleata TaxID=69824 RepID=UPI001B800B06|nr:hypothetical protein [Thomasclavelia cocleata]